MARRDSAHRPPATPTRDCSARSTRIASTSTSPRGLFMVDRRRRRAGGRRQGRRHRAARCCAHGSSARPARSPIAIREAITVANNEIHRAGRARPEWHGMACVLTVAVVEDGRAIDRPRRRHAALQAARRAASRRSRAITRRSASARTRARSPSSRRCGIRAATRSTATSARSRTSPTIPTSSTSTRSPFEPDAALLLCSDGLTDLVDSASINADRRAAARASPQRSSTALVDAANDAGGKDNVTVVYVEGEQFRGDAPDRAAPATSRGRHGTHAPARRCRTTAARAPARRARWPTSRCSRSWSCWRSCRRDPVAPPDAAGATACAGRRDTSRDRRAAGRVDRGGARSARAPGTTIVVEPGEYRETSDAARAASGWSAGCRAARSFGCPATASEAEPRSSRRMSRTPSSSGSASSATRRRRSASACSTDDSDVSLVDVEITGATTGRDRHRRRRRASARRRATSTTTRARRWPSAPARPPRSSHNVFARNGASGRGAATVDRRARRGAGVHRQRLHGHRPEASSAGRREARARVRPQTTGSSTPRPPVRRAPAPRGRRRGRR